MKELSEIIQEMEGWFESFMEEFGKPFIYID